MENPLNILSECGTQEILSSDLEWSKGVIVEGVSLLPAVVQDRSSGRLLMLGWQNQLALEQTCATGLATFWSRSRGRLWTKGETSGHWMRVRSIHVDCDQDTIALTVDPDGPACHRGWPSCFHCDEIEGLGWLSSLQEILAREPRPGGYVEGLMAQGASRIAQKIGEEGVETSLALVAATTDATREMLADEAADLLFHLMIGLQWRGLKLADIVEVLRRRRQRSRSHE